MPDISAVCGVELLIWLLFPELLTAVAGLLITETVTPLSEYLKKIDFLKLGSYTRFLYNKICSWLK